MLHELLCNILIACIQTFYLNVLTQDCIDVMPLVHQERYPKIKGHANQEFQGLFLIFMPRALSTQWGHGKFMALIKDFF